MKWTLEDALPLIEKIEAICPEYGCHVALTGGVLYKRGEPRKDLDLLFYRIRQTEKIDTVGLFEALRAIGIERTTGWGWVHKAALGTSYLAIRKIDMFFPEEDKVSEEHTHANNGCQEYRP